MLAQRDMSLDVIRDFVLILGGKLAKELDSAGLKNLQFLGNWKAIGKSYEHFNSNGIAR